METAMKVGSEGGREDKVPFKFLIEEGRGGRKEGGREGGKRRSD